MNVCALLKLEGRDIEASDYVVRRLPEMRKNERPRLLEFASSLGLSIH